MKFYIILIVMLFIGCNMEPDKLQSYEKLIKEYELELIKTKDNLIQTTVQLEQSIKATDEAIKLAIVFSNKVDSLQKELDKCR